MMTDEVVPLPSSPSEHTSAAQPQPQPQLSLLDSKVMSKYGNMLSKNIPEELVKKKMRTDGISVPKVDLFIKQFRERQRTRSVSLDSGTPLLINRIAVQKQQKIPPLHLSAPPTSLSRIQSVQDSDDSDFEDEDNSNVPRISKRLLSAIEEECESDLRKYSMASNSKSRTASNVDDNSDTTEIQNAAINLLVNGTSTYVHSSKEKKDDWKKTPKTHLRSSSSPPLVSLPVPKSEHDDKKHDHFNMIGANFLKPNALSSNGNSNRNSRTDLRLSPRSSEKSADSTSSSQGGGTAGTQSMQASKNQKKSPMISLSHSPTRSSGGNNSPRSWVDIFGLNKIFQKSL